LEAKPNAQQTHDETPHSTTEYWVDEFAAAQKEVERWHQRGDKIIRRFLDERDASTDNTTRWNLFTANVQTQRAIMYGKTPKVSVSRRFSDSDDDQARVAGEMLERVLNTDIEKAHDGYKEALFNCLQDYQLPGLGNARVRYVAQFETQPATPAVTTVDPMTGQEIVLAPEVPAREVKVYEDVETVYAHWRDQLWSPARVFSEVRWWAFKNTMSKPEVQERFGEELAKLIPYSAKGKSRGDDVVDAKKYDPRDCAEVWEIWDKETRTVYWYVKDYQKLLDKKEDPLGLEGFFPFPKPLAANLTTSKFVPTPDFYLAQDIYNEIDQVSERISLLERAVKVAGVYDKTQVGLARLLSEGMENVLIPVDNWAGLAEKGGIRGVVDWLPIEKVVQAMDKLREYRVELQSALYQVTGMSDIMRGQAAASATATEQSIKAKFASVRLQAQQDEFARFASEVQALRAEIISKHFDPQTIVQRSNIMATPDAQMAGPAVELIKSKFYCYRIEVKPDAINLTDAAAIKQERGEVIGILSQFFASLPQLLPVFPGGMPFLLKLAQWFIAGTRGASEMEGVFDQAIATAQQMPPQQPGQLPGQPGQPGQQQGPNPMQEKMLEAKLQAQHTQQAHMNDLQRIQAETQAEVVKQQAQHVFNVREQEHSERLKAQTAMNNLLGGGGQS
jgi:hypothetical protein